MPQCAVDGSWATLLPASYYSLLLAGPELPDFPVAVLATCTDTEGGWGSVRR